MFGGWIRARRERRLAVPLLAVHDLALSTATIAERANVRQGAALQILRDWERLGWVVSIVVTPRTLSDSPNTLAPKLKWKITESGAKALTWPKGATR